MGERMNLKPCPVCKSTRYKEYDSDTRLCIECRTSMKIQLWENPEAWSQRSHPACSECKHCEEYRDTWYCPNIDLSLMTQDFYCKGWEAKDNG